MGGANCNIHFVFHFVSLVELKINKMILSDCAKLIVRVSYLCVIFLHIYKTRASR